MEIQKELSGVVAESFSIGEAGAEFLGNRPSRIPGGLLMVCDSGDAVVCVDSLKYTLLPGYGLLLLPGSIISMESVTEGFRARYVYLADSIFQEATFKLEADFFRFMKEHPVVKLDLNSLDFVDKWAALVSCVVADADNAFNSRMVGNLLQCLFWKSHDKMKRFFGRQTEKTGRQDEIFHEFMSLAKTHCRRQRDVEFYARKLFVSPRYLSYVCTHNAKRLSAKKLIDMQTVLEIKIMLETTNDPVQKIAERMRFPDQSYFGRFFKRYTGQSPLAYRFRRNENNPPAP
ncbi:MAG: helix-turn-helix domain-containing protein [Alistipes sp.]|nr:helix-turn-helix domain-containing protein [Alistipes sp.]